MMRPGASSAAALALALAAVGPALAVACIDPEAGFVYSARAYDAAGMCVGPYEELELVQGAGGSATCDDADAGAAGGGPVCLVSPSGAIYVSVVCAPYPPNYDASGDDPACAAALAALARGAICGADGGSDDGG